MKNIIAFTGSTNPDSINKKLLTAAIHKFPIDSVHFINLTDYNIPIYSQKIEAEGIPKAIKKLFQLFTKADGFIIASPEHNGLPSSFLKNIIDWLSRIDQYFFGDKPILLMSTSPGVNGGNSHLQILINLLPRWGGNLSGVYSLGDFKHKFDSVSLTITDPIENLKLNKVIQTFQVA